MTIATVPASLRRRLPDRRLPDRRQITSAYLACLVPIQLWSIIVAFYAVPAWLLQMDAWDVLGTVAYTQAFALFETTIIFAPLLLLAAVLPARWFADRFVALATGIVYLAVLWGVAAQFNDETLRQWGLSRDVLPWLGLFLLSQVALLALVHRSRRVEALIMAAVDRLSVLGALYLVIGLASVLIVLVRNI